MATYGFRCPECGDYEANLPMGSAPDMATHQVDWGFGDLHDVRSWLICLVPATRVMFVPQFTQDTRRFRNGISPVTRLPYAQSRREERQIEERMGIEFVSRDSRPQEWKEHEEYSDHLKAGGNSTEWKPVTPKSQPGYLLREYEKRAGK